MLDGEPLFGSVQSTWNVLEPSWCVLSGAVHPDQLASNVAATDLVLDADLLAELDEVAEDPRTYWAARSARAWS